MTFKLENSGRTVQYKLNAQSLRLFGLHRDVNDAHRAGANRLQNKQTSQRRGTKMKDRHLYVVLFVEQACWEAPPGKDADVADHPSENHNPVFGVMGVIMESIRPSPSDCREEGHARKDCSKFSAWLAGCKWCKTEGANDTGRLECALNWLGGQGSTTTGGEEALHKVTAIDSGMSPCLYRRSQEQEKRTAAIEYVMDTSLAVATRSGERWSVFGDYPRVFAVGDCNYGYVETPVKKPDDWAIPPIPKVEREDRTILPQEQLSSSAQASFEFTCTSVEEAMFWDCSVDLATVSNMPEGPRPNAVTKLATCAGKRQHGRRTMSSGTHVTETTVCSFRREVSATLTAICEEGNHIVRDESCLYRGATASTNDLFSCLEKHKEYKKERTTVSPS